MIEPDAVIGALIGLATGIIPFIISSFWRECRERRIAKERQAERDHALEMQRLNNQRNPTRAANPTRTQPHPNARRAVFLNTPYPAPSCISL